MKTFLIVGGAACVHEDLRAVVDMKFDGILAVNDMILDCSLPITAGVTAHFDESDKWASRGVPIWSFAKECAVTDRLQIRSGWYGTSGLYAVQVALDAYEADRVIVAGCPLDETGHYNKDKGLEYDDVSREQAVKFYRQGWDMAYPEIVGKVASLSGWTRRLLGSPEEVFQ